MTETASTPATPAPRKRRSDAYVARITITIPIDLSKPEVLTEAQKAVVGIEKTMPAGATVKIEAGMAKI